MQWLDCEFIGVERSAEVSGDDRVGCFGLNLDCFELVERERERRKEDIGELQTQQKVFISSFEY